MTSILHVKGIERAGDLWIGRFIRRMHDAGADPDMVAAVISFETAGSFDPQKRNPYSGAVGLIQWTEEGARTQGFSREQIARMDADEQSALIADWYGKKKRKASWRPIDYYLAVFAPSAIGKLGQDAVYSAPSAAYTQNKGLDQGGDGVITVSDISNAFMPTVTAARKRPRLQVSGGRIAHAVAGALGVALGGLGWWLERRRR